MATVHGLKVQAVTDLVSQVPWTEVATCLKHRAIPYRGVKENLKGSMRSNVWSGEGCYVSV